MNSCQGCELPIVTPLRPSMVLGMGFRTAIVWIQTCSIIIQASARLSKSCLTHPENGAVGMQKDRVCVGGGCLFMCAMCALCTLCMEARGQPFMLFIRHYSSLCVLGLTKYAKLGGRNLSVSIAPVLGLQGSVIMPSSFPWTLGIKLRPSCSCGQHLTG